MNQNKRYKEQIGHYVRMDDINKQKIALYNGTSQKYHTLSLRECDDLELKLLTATKEITQRKDNLIQIRLNCIICRDKPKCISFDGCKHIKICEECEKKLNPKKCPVCREPYQKSTRMFIL